VVRVWERVRLLDVATECVIATDSEEVADAVRAAGATVEMTDPAHPSGTDRVAEVAARPRYAAFDAIVNVQGDEPFVDPQAIGLALAQVTTHGFSLGTAAARARPEILADPNVVKVVAADDGRALYFSRAPIPYLRDGADASVLASRVLQHVGVYAYSRAALERWVGLPPHPLEQIERLEQLRPLADGISMGVGVIDGPVAGGIDTEDDLRRADETWPRNPTDES